MFLFCLGGRGICTASTWRRDWRRWRREKKTFSGQKGGKLGVTDFVGGRVRRVGKGGRRVSYGFYGGCNTDAAAGCSGKSAFMGARIKETRRMKRVFFSLSSRLLERIFFQFSLREKRETGRNFSPLLLEHCDKRKSCTLFMRCCRKPRKKY